MPTGISITPCRYIQFWKVGPISGLQNWGRLQRCDYKPPSTNPKPTFCQLNLPYTNPIRPLKRDTGTFLGAPQNTAWKAAQACSINTAGAKEVVRVLLEHGTDVSCPEVASLSSSSAWPPPYYHHHDHQNHQHHGWWWWWWWWRLCSSSWCCWP